MTKIKPSEILVLAVAVLIFAGLFAMVHFSETPNVSYAGRDWFQYESDGHVFLKRGQGVYEQIMHHPDCPCQKKEKAK